VVNKYLNKLKNEHRENFCSFIESVRNILEIRSLRRQLFEMVLHAVLCQRGSCQVCNLTEKGTVFETTHDFKVLKEENFFMKLCIK